VVEPRAILRELAPHVEGKSRQKLSVYKDLYATFLQQPGHFRASCVRCNRPFLLTKTAAPGSISRLS
jgi:hypothetical protein